MIPPAKRRRRLTFVLVLLLLTITSMYYYRTTLQIPSTTTPLPLTDSCINIIPSPLKDGDLVSLAEHVNFYFSILEDGLPGRNDCVEVVMKEFEKRLFHWMKPNVSFAGVRKGYAGRGIVLAAGYWQVRHAVVAIRDIREALGSKLPVEVLYAGDGDLAPSSAKILAALPDVTLTDLSTFMDVSLLLHWASKPFASLLSRFQEPILIDADAFFLRAPEEIYEFPGYVANGTMLFRDRTVVPGGGKDAETRGWVENVLRRGVPPGDFRGASAYAGTENRILANLSVHECDSGVVVVDKGRVANLRALVLTALMNLKQHREEVWDRLYGDKETWWLSHGTGQCHLPSLPNRGGAIGVRLPPPHQLTPRRQSPRDPHLRQHGPRDAHLGTLLVQRWHHRQQAFRDWSSHSGPT
ncbi:mannosyltransferase putative-domain-containing protein [Chytridium lagenaria]|nr:mannosyltransferase putative-domain-containing protein [Chytridium lagenaria]